MLALLPALIAAYGSAAAVVLLRSRSGGRPATVATWGLVPAVLLCPLLIPAASVGLRALAAVVAADVAFKLVDLGRRRGRSTRLGDDCRFLVPFPVFAVLPEQRRRLGRRERTGPNVVWVGVGVGGVVGSILALRGLSSCGPIRSSFALDHAAMLALFVVAIESLSTALCGLEHLLGFATTPICRQIYRSRTVAEFWRRYNNRIHDWLRRHVFPAAGGRRAPVRAAAGVFLASGLFHELMFGIATARFTGYQLAFFALQAPAVVASARLERLARRGGLAGQLVARGATIAYLAVTSVLFFDGVRPVSPFLYAGRSPLP